VLRSLDHERFDLEVRNVSGVREVKDAEGMVEFLKKVGINAEFEPVPRARQNDQEYRAKFPGASVSYQRSDDLLRWHSLSIPSGANAWRGENRGGYNRTEADRLIDAFYATLDRPHRYETLAQLMKLLSEDLPTVTVYHVTDVFAVRKGLVGAAPPGLAKRWTMSNAHELYWEQ
jgi:ABC-type transport system substrate-binding protein